MTNDDEGVKNAENLMTSYVNGPLALILNSVTCFCFLVTCFVH